MLRTTTLKTALTLLLAAFTFAFSTTLGAQEIPTEDFASQLKASNQTMSTHVGPPAGFEPFQSRAATITVNYTGFSAEAQTAFQYAVDIWASLLDSDVTISVDAYWEPLGDGVLGYAQALNFFPDFTGAPESDTYYPVALANKIAGFDLDPFGSDIEAHFSSSFDWYYGTDGNPSWDEYDFVTVVLHELGHGLGVTGSGYVTGGIGEYGLDFAGTPAVFDLFVDNGSGTNILNFPNNSSSLATQLESDNLKWSGAFAVAANGGNQPAIYAPNPFEGGSSFSHFDEDAFPAGNANSLMTPYLGYQESIHNPGPVGIGMLNDIGWNISTSSGGGCLPNSMVFEQFPCQDDGSGNILPVINITFDIDGLCEVQDLCFQADGGGYTCFNMPTEGFTLFDGDNINLTNTIADVWYDMYFTTIDGTSGTFSWFNGNCTGASTGCTNPFADNYNPSATTEDGSCIYSETICDCQGNEHTIGVMIWNGDGFADDGSYDWDGVPVFFNCDMWGNDCGDTGITGDPNGVCSGGLPANNGCAGGGCDAVSITATQGECQVDPDTGENLPVVVFTFAIDGGCQVQDLCYQVNGGGYVCTDMPLNGFDLFDGDGINLINTTPYGVYDIYYTTTDGDVSPIEVFVNGDCLGGGGCAINNINIYLDGCGDTGTNDMQFLFDYTGDCLVSEVCTESGDGTELYCFDLLPNNLESGDVWGITGLPVGSWDFWYTLDDGTVSNVGTLVIGTCTASEGCTNPYAINYDAGADTDDGSCAYNETICDCAGNEHTIGVLVWIGDGFADEGTYIWDETIGDAVFFDCDMWGNDCGDTGITGDPNGVCSGGLPANNGCEPDGIPGCMDASACNYDATATTDDGSCEYNSCAGCTNANACNYDATATTDDGSCEFVTCAGCTNANACNYDVTATIDDGSCEFVSCAGCTNPNACNWDVSATLDDGSCEFISCAGCTDFGACNWDPSATIDDGSCDFLSCAGCTEPGACNYDFTATINDGSCEYITCAGCTDPAALNFDPTATIDDGSCFYVAIMGCIDPTACNYDPAANTDNGTCEYLTCAGCIDPTACNYDATATLDDGTCEYLTCAGCTDPVACNYDATATLDDNTCEYETCAGCTDPDALNYDADATFDDGSCIYDCDYPTLTWSTFCEDGEDDVFYILLDVDALGNGAPYLVTNNQNDEEYQVSFNGTVEIGPFANDTDVLVTVGSMPFPNCLLTSPLLSDNCTGDNVGELTASTLHVYPNPTTGNVTVEFPQSGTWQLGLYTADGRLVANLQTNAEANAPLNWQLPVDLASGVYTLRALQDGQLNTLRLIVH